MTLDPVSVEYLSISFALDRLFPGFIDAYFGPEEIKSAALAAPEPRAADLIDRARVLSDEVTSGDYPASRRAFLQTQIRAIETIARKLEGEEIAYVDEVRGCFDIEPIYTPESTLDAAIAELDTLLPGTGDVRERMIEWKKGFVVSTEIARNAIDLITSESKQRTMTFVDLPADGGIDFVFVEDKPWSGYNWYLGNYRSRVDINTDLPIHIHELPALITHEGYPGHHAEHALKELVLYHGHGFGEHAIQLINTPECVISEGIATLAESIVFAGDDGDRWLAETLYPAAGIAGDPEREGRIARAKTALRAVGGNAALRLHTQGQSESEVVDYLMTYGLRTEKEAKQSFKFISDPLWSPYIFTYHVGRDLLGSWLETFPESERPSRYHALLTEQITPSMITAQIGD